MLTRSVPFKLEVKSVDWKCATFEAPESHKQIHNGDKVCRIVEIVSGNAGDGARDVYAVKTACGDKVFVPFGESPQGTSEEVNCLGCLAK